MLAGDERLGLRQGTGVRPDEPMDTIFVKNVRENGPAYLAGLSTGDRIISVNGETVAGKSYAHVVQVIQQTQCYLYLLVVPMENDIIQLVSLYTVHGWVLSELDESEKKILLVNLYVFLIFCVRFCTKDNLWKVYY